MELLDKPRKIAGTNTEEQFANLNSFFKTIDQIDADQLKNRNIKTFYKRANKRRNWKRNR